MKKVTLGMLALVTSAFATSAFAAQTVPEPGTFGLLAAGIAGVVAVRLIKRK